MIWTVLTHSIAFIVGGWLGMFIMAAVAINKLTEPEFVGENVDAP